MIQLIADSGSSKTDWCLITPDEKIFLQPTSGLNPFFVDNDQIASLLKKEMIPQLSGYNIQQISFYGAGCSSTRNNNIVASGLNVLIDDPAKINVEHDLLGAARALCGDSPGIATILGTGSNSCFFDGKKIIKNITALGYVMGDEGSGAYMGKKLLPYIIHDKLPVDLANAFKVSFRYSKDDLLNKVYNEPLPNRFLAQFATFIGRFIDHKFFHDLVFDSFNEFIKTCILPYDKKQEPVHSVGSIAFNFSKILTEVLEKHSLVKGKIIQSPIAELVNYHEDK